MSDLYDTDIPIWSERQAELLRRHAAAARRFAPSMRQKIDLEHLYHQALRAVPQTIDGAPPLPMPATCPVTLDELLAP
jgi:hypothetical protein